MFKSLWGLDADTCLPRQHFLSRPPCGRIHLPGSLGEAPPSPTGSHPSRTGLRGVRWGHTAGRRPAPGSKPALAMEPELLGTDSSRSRGGWDRRHGVGPVPSQRLLALRPCPTFQAASPTTGAPNDPLARGLCHPEAGKGPGTSHFLPRWVGGGGVRSSCGKGRLVGPGREGRLPNPRAPAPAPGSAWTDAPSPGKKARSDSCHSEGALQNLRQLQELRAPTFSAGRAAPQRHVSGVGSRFSEGLGLRGRGGGGGGG